MKNGKTKKGKLKWFRGILKILFVLLVGFFIGAGYSTKFLLNHIKDIHIDNVYEQISYLVILREGLTEEAIESMDRKLIHSLYLTTNYPKEFPEDITKWPNFTLKTWQKAKEYYEKYPTLLEGQSERYRVVRQILEKVPDSDRRIKEKEFAKKHIGQKAPVLSVSQWIGEPITLEDLKGKVVLLDFWGKWCGPCLLKLPYVQELHEKYKSRGLEVVGIHSLRTSENLTEFMSENNYTFRSGLDTGQTELDYSVAGWPTYYLIDKQGRLVWGPEHSAPPEELIESLLQE